MSHPALRNTSSVGLLSGLPATRPPPKFSSLARTQRAAVLGTLLFGTTMLSTSTSAQAADDCITQAARYHGVNSVVLRAIGYTESRLKSWEINKNSNGSYDIGLMQTNTVHLQELAQYGIAPGHLQDACVSAYVGAWMYRKKVNKYGNTWIAVGAYHSETPHLRDAYARRVMAVVQNWTGQTQQP